MSGTKVSDHCKGAWSLFLKAEGKCAICRKMILDREHRELVY